MHRGSWLLVVIFLLVPGWALAQQPEPLTYVGTFKVKPGKEESFVNFVKKYDQPMFEKLMAEGTVLAWGLDAALLHHQGEATHNLWVSVPSYAAVDKLLAAFVELGKQMKADDEQRAAEARRLKQPVPKTAEQDLMEAFDFDQHQDFVLRSVVFNIKPVPADTLPYTGVFRFRVERGRGEDYRKLWEKYDKPIWDKLLADGMIFGYGIDVEDWTSMGGGWRWLWVSLPDMATTDKIDAAFRADRDKRSEEERAAIGRQFREVIVAGSGHDDLYRAVMFAAK
jgi:hypothetical protein